MNTYKLEKKTSMADIHFAPSSRSKRGRDEDEYSSDASTVEIEGLQQSISVSILQLRDAVNAIDRIAPELGVRDSGTSDERQTIMLGVERCAALMPYIRTLLLYMNMYSSGIRSVFVDDWESMAVQIGIVVRRYGSALVSGSSTFIASANCIIDQTRSLLGDTVDEEQLLFEPSISDTVSVDDDSDVTIDDVASLGGQSDRPSLAETLYVNDDGDSAQRV